MYCRAVASTLPLNMTESPSPTPVEQYPAAAAVGVLLRICTEHKRGHGPPIPWYMLVCMSPSIGRTEQGRTEQGRADLEVFPPRNNRTEGPEP